MFFGPRKSPFSTKIVKHFIYYKISEYLSDCAQRTPTLCKEGVQGNFVESARCVCHHRKGSHFSIHTM